MTVSYDCDILQNIVAISLEEKILGRFITYIFISTSFFKLIFFLLLRNYLFKDSMYFVLISSFTMSSFNKSIHLLKEKMFSAFKHISNMPITFANIFYYVCT